jgi:hypothetical protein
MTTDLDELLAGLKRDLDLAEQNAETFELRAGEQRYEARFIAARIQGIEEARAALSRAPAEAVHGILKPERRKIRELVEAWCECHTQDASLEPGYIAKNIGCRKSQVEAALKALAGDKAKTYDVAATP